MLKILEMPLHKKRRQFCDKRKLFSEILNRWLSNSKIKELGTMVEHLMYLCNTLQILLPQKTGPINKKPIPEGFP